MARNRRIRFNDEMSSMVQMVKSIASAQCGDIRTVETRDYLEVRQADNGNEFVLAAPM
jgi:hypothetical protein